MSSSLEFLKIVIFGYISDIEKQYKLITIIPQCVGDLILLYYLKLHDRLFFYPTSTLNAQISLDSDGYRLGRWFIGEIIEKSDYSFIKKGIDRKTGRIVSIKFKQKRLTQNNEWKKYQETNVKTEIEVLRSLRHENITRILAYDINAIYSDSNGKSHNVILYVLEYAAGGQLFDLFYYTETEKLEPILARTYFRQLVDGMEYMHKNGIIHRNIKPQNLLLDNKYNLKINIEMNGWPWYDYNGRGFQAPEILLRKRDHDKKTDIFAMGVILFMLLAGYPPFIQARHSDKWYGFIARKKYKNFWKSHRNCGLRQEETDLITRMICFDTDKRVSMEKIKKHRWFLNTEIVCSSDLRKLFSLRHQRMEEQRHNDPDKQKMLVPSIRHEVAFAVKNAGKRITDKPPTLPEDECINPYDIYTSTYNNAYEVLQALEIAITENLKGILLKPNYMEIDQFNDDERNRGSVDVINFSLIFKAAIIDLRDGSTASVCIHVGLYYCDKAECNLVKFRRLCGDRELFAKIMGKLSIVCGEYLSGLDKKNSKIMAEKQKNDECIIEHVYNKCFPNH